jgi:predicted kinase
MLEATDKGKNVVLDATFYKDKFRELFIINSREKIAFIKVWANEKLTQERIQKKRKFSEADFDVYKSLKQEWEPVKQPHLILESTNENIDAMLQKAEEYLKDDKRTN